MIAKFTALTLVSFGLGLLMTASDSNSPQLSHVQEAPSEDAVHLRVMKRDVEGCEVITYTDAETAPTTATSAQELPTQDSAAMKMKSQADLMAALRNGHAA